MLARFGVGFGSLHTVGIITPHALARFLAEKPPSAAASLDRLAIAAQPIAIAFIVTIVFVALGTREVLVDRFVAISEIAEHTLLDGPVEREHGRTRGQVRLVAQAQIEAFAIGRIRNAVVFDATIEVFDSFGQHPVHDVGEDLRAPLR